jgi:Flp pilus assembly protein TadB
VLSFVCVVCVRVLCIVFWFCVLFFAFVCCVCTYGPLVVCVVFPLCVLCFALMGHRRKESNNQEKH